jgi:transglutaminase-like putative cysteine protease
MTYKITHSTTYTYAAPVSVCHNLVRLTPREEPGLHCRSHRLVIRPAPPVSARHTDFFGNQVHAFSIEENHRQLTVTANSRIDVVPRDFPPPATTVPWTTVVAGLTDGSDPHWLEACLFLFDSPRARRSPEFAAYAAGCFAAGKPILQAVLDLTSQIRRDFKYDKHATSVTTAAEDAFRLRKGVCQDFAHIEIACLRSLGLPAQYVSGYLRTIPPPGKPRLIGADQSHAWLSVYCGSELDWVDVDPTNDALCSTDHIPIARGRDYGDVVPIKGVFLGGGEHQLTVSVDVAPLDETGGDS